MVGTGGLPLTIYFLKPEIHGEVFTENIGVGFPEIEAQKK